jgi:hypothetical protein
MHGAASSPTKIVIAAAKRQRRLTSSVGAKTSQPFSRARIKVDAIDGNDLALALPKVS